MTIAIYGRPTPDNKCPEVFQLLDTLQALQVDILIDGIFYNFLSQFQPLSKDIKKFTGFVDLEGTADFLLSLGGDGTLLETVSLVRSSGLPILGINTGRLGFLASVSKDDIVAAIQNLMENKFTLDQRTLVQVDTENNLFGTLNFALNEINIHGKESSSMITIHTHINGEYLNSYWSDGLIVATPTGSTGYSLSCGGPIVIPDSKSLILTPISPHNLSARPLIISDTDKISLKVESRSKNYRVSLDSRTIKVDNSVIIHIRKADFHIKLVRLEKVNFIETLRNKLLWGIDKRN